MIALYHPIHVLVEDLLFASKRPSGTVQITIVINPERIISKPAGKQKFEKPSRTNVV